MANRGAGAQACNSKLEEVKYLIFSFPRFGNEISALSLTAQYAILLGLGGKRGTEVS